MPPPPPPRARRARAPALPLALLALLAAASLAGAAGPGPEPLAPAGPGKDPLANEGMLFYSDGPNLVLTTKAWTLIAPLTEKEGSGAALPARRAATSPCSPHPRHRPRAPPALPPRTPKAPALPASGQPPPPPPSPTAPLCILLPPPGKVGLFILGKSTYAFRTPGLIWVSVRGGARGGGPGRPASAPRGEPCPSAARCPALAPVRLRRGAGAGRREARGGARRRAAPARRPPPPPPTCPSPFPFPPKQLPKLKINRLVKLRNVNMRPVAPALSVRAPPPPRRRAPVPARLHPLRSPTLALNATPPPPRAIPSRAPLTSRTPTPAR
jgi:hypothetical protein